MPQPFYDVSASPGDNATKNSCNDISSFPCTKCNFYRDSLALVLASLIFLTACASSPRVSLRRQKACAPYITQVELMFETACENEHDNVTVPFTIDATVSAWRNILPSSLKVSDESLCCLSVSGARFNVSLSLLRFFTDSSRETISAMLSLLCFTMTLSSFLCSFVSGRSP